MAGGVSLGNPTCGSCCFTMTKCGGSADYGSNCLPRRLCIKTEFTPGPYFDGRCGLLDPYGTCCDEINFCIQGGNSDSGCGWSGTGVCNEFCNVTVAVPVDIRLVEVDGLMYTRVDSPYLDAPLDFRGILGKYRNDDGTYTTDPISWVMVDDEGNEYACEIAFGNGLHNPQFQDVCGPCKCGTCVPSQFCATLKIGSHTDSVLITCERARVWRTATISLPTGIYGEDEDYTIDIRLPNDFEQSKGCVLIVKVAGGAIESSDGGFQENSIPLEGQLEPPADPDKPMDGVVCKDESDNAVTITDGKGSAQNPATYRDMTVVDTDISLSDGSGEIGTLTIKDASCNGPCRPVLCNCCQLPDTIYVTVDTYCLFGVLALTVASGSGETTIWQVNGVLKERNCNTVYPFEEHIVDEPVFATAQCLADIAGVAVSIGGPSTNLFSIRVPSCDGGTIPYDDPVNVSNWSIGGTCCALYGIGLNGSITVSA